MASETTLVLFKPDCVQKNLCGEILKRFESEGFKICGLKMMRLNDAILKEHYAHIADLPFFPDVASFMQSSPVVALALSGDDAITRVRDLLGPTDSTQATKGTIRGDFGVDKMTNVCHASDSPEAAAAEIARFFDSGETFDY